MSGDGATTPKRQALLATYRRESWRSTTPARPLAEALRADWPGTIGGLAQDELLAELLVTTPIYPSWLEASMTELRRKLMLGHASEPLSGLISNLAIQCHLNEYVWAVTPEEQAQVGALAARLESLTPVQVMMLGCYVPLRALPGAEALLRKGWSGPVAAVLIEQVAQPWQERALDARIPRITPIRDGVSSTVRAQYEANPYPRWRTLPALPQVSVIAGWKLPPSPQVLIAGCGTGLQALRSARRYPSANVLAVDLSRQSLVYGYRKSREMGFRNIAFAQADLLELDPTVLRFDIVESGGVLHHMADPFEGARAVCRTLKVGGAIKLGLYSATARRGLKPAKDLARRYAPETIRELRQAILAAPEGDPLHAPGRFIDFYSMSSCRDLLMHVQEHELGFQDLKRMLSENGLRFLTFAIGDDVIQAYRQRFPGDPDARDLDRWADFEQERPSTFSGMYQFWAEKVA